MKRSSMNTTLPAALSLLVITSSQLILILNTKNFLVSRYQKITRSLNHFIWMIPTWLVLSIGETWVQWMESKIKVNVDHAGPSLPPQLSKVHTSIQVLVPYCHFQNNNWWIVTKHAIVVMVVSHQELWHTWKLIHKISKMIMFIKPRLVTHAMKTNTKDRWKYSQWMKLSQNLYPNWRLPLQKTQQLSVLKQTRKCSSCTNQAFLTLLIVELASITLSQQLGTTQMEIRTTTSLEIHGALDGVMVDTSRLQLLMELVSVVFNKFPAGQLLVEQWSHPIYDT